MKPSKINQTTEATGHQKQEHEELPGEKFHKTNKGHEQSQMHNKKHNYVQRVHPIVNEDKKGRKI